MSGRERPLDRIAPAGFVDKIDEQASVDIATVDEALEYAHRHLPSSTPKSQMPRCIGCGSVRVRSKPGDNGRDYDHRVDTEYKCTNCMKHADKRAPPAAEAPDYSFKNTDQTMNDSNSAPFEWIETDNLAEPNDRGLTHPLGGVDNETLTELVLRAYRPWTDGGPSYRDLGRVLPYSRKWVGERVREWKDGDHRDVVTDPRPTADTPGDDRFEWVGDTRTVATDGGEA